MILRNWQRPGFLVGATVLTLSATLHAAGMLAVAPTDEVVQLPAGGQGETAALGSSFADFAAGAVPVTPAAQPVPDAPVQEAVQQEVQKPVTETPAQPVEPAAQPKSAPAPTPAPSAQAVPQTVAPAVTAVTPETTNARPAESAPTPPAQAETVQAIDPPPEQAESAAPTTSARPQARPETPPRQRAAQQPPAPTRQTQQAAPRPAGNSDADAQRGSATGQQTGQSAAAGQTQRQTNDSGNAAASNYPGEVLRKITRQRRAAAPRGGKVLVAFSISGSGALASAAVARSSGSPALDRVALNHIRRSAPFTPPPQGAQTSFTFEFVSNR